MFILYFLILVTTIFTDYIRNLEYLYGVLIPTFKNKRNKHAFSYACDSYFEMGTKSIQLHSTDGE